MTHQHGLSTGYQKALTAAAVARCQSTIIFILIEYTLLPTPTVLGVGKRLINNCCSRFVGLDVSIVDHSSFSHSSSRQQYHSCITANPITSALTVRISIGVLTSPITMAPKDTFSSSKFLFVSSILATAFGAFRLGTKSTQIHKSKSNSTPTKMLSPGHFLTSLLSLSFLSSSQSFAPVTRVNNKIESKTLLRSGNDENQKITEDIYDRPDKPDESLVQSITMQPVGHVSSVYQLCVGTPRQGLLAPNSRGRIDLYPDRIGSDSVLSLDSFSHVWVMFIFHLNTTPQKKFLENGEEDKRPFPSKIKPPALGGKRVGVFATRTPHRPNQIGFR